MNILIVDDQQTNLLLFKSLISRLGNHRMESQDNPLKALEWCRNSNPDLVILDYMMPEMDGLQFLQQFRQQPHCADVPLLMVTADHEKELRYRALELSANDFLTKPIDKIEFNARTKNMLQLRRQQLALKDRTVHLQMEIDRATAEIRERERETIHRLANAAEFRDNETGAHILRMAHFAEMIATQLGLGTEECDKILYAAPMHDIGKVGIPDQILLKPGALSGAEFDIIQTHAVIGYNILHGSSSKLLQIAADIAHTHHEKFDGSGYPRGLRGAQIPLVGRICAVADVFDALTSARPYKPAWTFNAAAEQMLKDRGTHFDPDCLDAFFHNVSEIEAICKKYADIPEAGVLSM